MTRLLAPALAAAALLAAGCSATSPVFGSRTVDASALDGPWTTAEGDTIIIDASAAGRLRVLEAGDHRTGVLLDVHGVTIAEIDLSPDATGDATPIYHYGRVELDADTLTHRPLDPAWLQRQCADDPFLRAVDVTGVNSRVAVGDAAAMRTLLERAVKDDAAWGAPQTLTRAR